ncbi:unnamed protein product [Chironomus riparius]|uniref:F-box domain-containing protein n=1 Tax=Chironomus riparius TaxID=315576 RepID=A0A9N9WVA9_9DIPT|nr:unnamed protein product [Chironomus riparius]
MDFPPEIIKSILNHLELNDLKKCLLVSKEINQLIIKSPELMRKFDVILFHETWKEKLPFIKKFGFFIRSLRFQDVGFDDENQFKRILRETPNLERLSFTDCYIMERDEDRHEHNEEMNVEHPENEEIIENIVDNNDENHNIEPNAQEEQPPDINEIQNDIQIMDVDLEEPNVQINPNNANIEEMAIEIVDVIDEAENVQNADLMVAENNPMAAHNIDNQDMAPENVDNQEQALDNEAMAIENNPNNEMVAESKATDEQKDPEEDPVTETEIDLNYLTYLHLESSSIAESVIRYIKNCNKLKYLKLTFYYQEPKTEFTNFVCQQDNLKELILQGYSDMMYKSLFHVDINENVKFKLKTLSLECELSYNRHFSNFFRAQSESIKDLIISCYNIDFHFCRVLFNNFKKLEKLSLPSDWTLNDTRVNIIKNCRLDSVKELELVGSNDDLETFKTFINIFPNIESLKCENLSSFSLYGILENFHKLKFIHADSFRCDTMLFVNMPSLKTLEIDFLSPTGSNFYWDKLTHDCPNIENLYIEDIGNFKLNASIKIEFSIIIRNLTNWKHLKVCRIACCPPDNSLNPDEDANENERIQDQNPFYKVEINIEEKTIKVSNYFVNHCNEEVELIREIFKECDISEL